MKIKWGYFVVFFLLFAIIGYYREKFFLAYNHLMYIKYYNQTNDLPLDEFIHVFDDVPYKTLYYLKYPFTALSFLVFGSLSVFSTQLILGEKKIWRWVVYSYVLLLTLAALSMLIGYFVNNRLQDDEYTLSRWLMGIAQSPIITIVIIASYQLIKQPNKNTTE